MNPFRRFLAWLAHQWRGDERPALVHPRGWLRRNWAIGPVVVLALVGGLLVWRPFQPEPLCGRGLTAVGSPHICAGLDLESTGFRDNDPLADLEKHIAEQNTKITGQLVTIVYLDNMTPDPNRDSDKLESLRFRIEGAITAVWRANNQAVTDGVFPKIKLLLANYDGGAMSWREAVEAIKQARTSENIRAVTGIGQSLDQTREAVAALSDANIATVGAVVTADNMNEDLHGQYIENFVRVAPLNSDEAQAAVPFITSRNYQRILLVKDKNEQDSYAQTLASEFSSAYKSWKHEAVEFTAEYRSPENPPSDATRHEQVTDQFAAMHSDICAIQPDLIYFAGRGLDLMSFLTALSQGGACSLGPIDVMTGDSAAALIGEKLPPSTNVKVRVFYTSLAYSGQWDEFPLESDVVKNYRSFADAFSNEENGFSASDLTNGHAIMSHDAALTAAIAIRLNPHVLTDPNSVADYFLRLHCQHSVPGASGTIALDPTGNPINKAMPILQVQPDGLATLEDLAWPDGRPLDPKTTC